MARTKYRRRIAGSQVADTSTPAHQMPEGGIMDKVCDSMFHSRFGVGIVYYAHGKHGTDTLRTHLCTFIAVTVNNRIE